MCHPEQDEGSHARSAGILTCPIGRRQRVSLPVVIQDNICLRCWALPHFEMVSLKTKDLETLVRSLYSLTCSL